MTEVRRSGAEAPADIGGPGRYVSCAVVFAFPANRKEADMKGRHDESKAGARGARWSAAHLEDWLLEYLVDQIGVERTEVDLALDLSCYGLGSMELTSLLVDLEKWLGARLSRSILTEHLSIRSLARRLGREVAAGTSVAPIMSITSRAPGPGHCASELRSQPARSAGDHQ